jgi:peptidylprolyl isomerase
MTDLIKIDDEVITTDSFVTLLKLTGRYDNLMEEIIKDKLAVQAAKRQKLDITPEEAQERADQIRRVWGLHRASDTIKWLDTKGITLDEFEQFVTDILYHEKIMEQVTSDAAIKEYFNLNSPKFDSIIVSHIIVDSEGTAKELMAILEDDPDSFADLAREHSLADTSTEGGYIGKVIRGALQPEIESKVFNASEGDLLGPFPSADENFFEIFIINAKVSAELNEDTTDDVRRIVRDEWLAARAKEHNIEIL